jgi:hypothetical protein
LSANEPELKWSTASDVLHRDASNARSEFLFATSRVNLCPPKGRYVTFQNVTSQMAEVAVSWKMFAEILSPDLPTANSVLA